MKLTELKCTACGGSVKPDPENHGIVECEYCHSRFTVESENNMTPIYREPISYTPTKQPEGKKDGEFRWWHGIMIAVVLVGAVGYLYGPQLYQKYQENQVAVDQEVPDGAGEDAFLGDGENMGESVRKTLAEDPILSAFCENVFFKPAEDLSEAERSKIKWLEFRSGIDNWEIGYSFESPTENAEAELTWLSFPRDDFQQANLSCLTAFPELAFIGSVQTIHAEDISGLPITGIKGRFSSLEEVAELVEDPAAVTWIEIGGEVIDLSGIEKFPNLETLVISGEIKDEKVLVQASDLKSLSLELRDGEMDFNTAAMIPGLERLSIFCYSLRDIGFVADMKDLKALHIKGGAVISVESLRNCTQLTELTLEDCDEVTDFSAVSALTNLRKLSLELPFGCAQPDLSSLTQIEELSIEGFHDVGFMAGMKNLESLTMHRCLIRDTGIFSQLTNIKNLTCTSYQMGQIDYGFIAKMTELETVDLRATETHADLSGIFNLPALKSLNISGMRCEIDFDKIAENTSLKELYMDNMKLCKNVEISGGNGIQYVDWDDVSLAENLAFLENLKGLEKLSIKENKLAGIKFATKLPELQVIDFSENYVTDVSPLAGLDKLITVIGTDNPVSNYEVLGESVVVFE